MLERLDFVSRYLKMRFQHFFKLFPNINALMTIINQSIGKMSQTRMVE